jgi:phosphoglycolate phosphatase
MRRGAIVFDLDGTLVDTSGDIVASANHIRGLCGLPPLDPRSVLNEVGFGATRLVSRMTGIPEVTDELRRALARFREYYGATQGTCSRPYPGVPEMLASLARELDLYVLSNKPHEATVREVEIQGLTRHFRGVFGGGRMSALKPDPAGVLEALRTSGVGPDRGAMVGDLIVDMETGARAGVSLFLVTWGFARPLVGFDGPYETAATPAELAEKIERAFPAF